MGKFARWSVAVVLGTMLAGCGEEEEDLSKFIGEWQYTSGTSNTQCPMLPAANDTQQLTNQKFRIAKGIDAPLVISEDECTWKLSVSGATVSIDSGQTCMFTDADGIVYNVSYSTATLTVTGSTGTFSGSGTIMANVNGAILNCSTTATGGVKRNTTN